MKVDLTYQQVRRNDVLVLCSDGLSGQMRADDIARIVSGSEDLAIACRRLVDLANENGGPDNITVVAVRFDGNGLEIAESAESVGHRVYTSEAEQRVTMPVDAKVIPADEQIVSNAGPGPMANIAGRRPTPDTPYQAPTIAALSSGPLADGGERQPERGRISEGTLRVVFGIIGTLVGAFILYRLMRDR